MHSTISAKLNSFEKPKTVKRNTINIIIAFAGAATFDIWCICGHLEWCLFNHTNRIQFV